MTPAGRPDEEAEPVVGVFGVFGVVAVVEVGGVVGVVGSGPGRAPNCRANATGAPAVVRPRRRR
ncbi:hypothetical protein ASD48_25240 [Streptomyces sp. Root1310]|nr:hypothetical protein ASD48_25240 [Streptomyces sp. Root1310]